MKTIRVFLACLLTLSIFSLSRPAHAVVGLATGNPVVTVLGAATLGGSVIFLTTGSSDDLGTSLLMAFWGFIAGAVGLTLLDGEEAMEFAELSTKDALSLGITPEEREAFNTEIDQVNAVAEAVSAELPEKPTADDAKVLWAHYGESLHPQALIATTKVARSMFKKQ